jgi:hypothetical protein
MTSRCSQETDLEKVHYVSSLTVSESACGFWDTSMRVTLDAARVSCPDCVKRMRPAEMPEAALLRAIRQAANSAGFLSYHTLRSDGSEKGWPDLALAKPGHPLYLLELKTAMGKLTVEQDRWMSALAFTTGIHAQVVRPVDLAAILWLLKKGG